ncbi:MAG: YaaR family protein [Treponema sp.]|nr:YaaR family protein [Treponema sp.]
MNSVDPLNQSLYFAAASAASRQVAANIKKNEKSSATKKTSFLSNLEESIAKEELIAQGLPIEIAGLSEEEAVVFLKDAVDAAGDVLVEKMTQDAFISYRMAITQFMTFVEKRTFDIEKIKRRGFNRRTGKPRDPSIQIHIINTKLNNLASDLLYNHLDKLKLLAKVDEINGLLVDLLAA